MNIHHKDTPTDVETRLGFIATNEGNQYEHRAAINNSLHI